MASHTISTSDMREAGATQDFFKGLMGNVRVFEMATVANGDVLNIGFGCQFVAWENYVATNSPMSAVFDGVDRVTFETSVTPTGRLWAFYKTGAGGQTTGGTTHAADGVREVGRDLGKLRPVIFSVTAIANGNTSALNLTGIRHLLTRATTGNIASARFTNSTNQGIGTVTWAASGSGKTSKLIALCGPGTGLS